MEAASVAVQPAQVRQRRMTVDVLEQLTFGFMVKMSSVLSVANRCSRSEIGELIVFEDPLRLLSLGVHDVPEDDRCLEKRQRVDNVPES